MNKDPSFIALVPAAGEGRRLGFNIPKALVKVGDLTLTERTLHALLDGFPFERVLVMVPQGFKEQFSQIDFSRAKLEFLEGGATRQESVRKGLEHVKNSPPDFVFIHDAARCFVSPELIGRCVKAALQDGAVTAALPAVDSLVRVQGDAKRLEYINRENLYCIQTPQVFKFAWLYEAHAKSAALATDDASLVQAYHPIRLVEGERANLKITTSEDLALLEKAF